jgi:MFS family permease
LGALIGAIYLASIKSDKNIIKILMIASILFFISLILFSFSQAIMLALVFATTGGLGRMIQMGSSNTYIQTNVEDDMRGRILSFYVMALQGMQPFGSMLVGFVAHKIGAPLAVCLQGIAGVIVFLIFIPSIRRAGLRQEVKIRWARREVESYKL